jgi:tetratricopeptide (TPR) repeat protein
MKKQIAILVLILILGKNSWCQFFFIPIVVPNQNVYIPFSCSPANKTALDYYKKGIEKIKSKEIEVAIIYFKGSISKDSLFCDAYEGLAYCYRLKNEPKNALEIINSSLIVNASNYSAQKTKGFILLMDLKDYDQSAQYFMKQSNAQPENPFWLYYFTKSLIGLNLLDSADAMARKTQWALTSQNDENAMAIGLYLMGEIAYKSGNYEGACRAFGLIKDSYKKDAEFCCFYGISLLKLPSPDKKHANKFIKKAQKLGYPVDTEIARVTVN